MSNAMSNAQRRRRDEGWSPRRRAESLGAERHNRGHDRRLVPGLAHSAASRKRPSSPRGVFSSGRVYVLTWLVGMMGIGRGRVSAQYVDGGKVSMDCADCSCSGSSDDGTIDVFRSPSSGELVASVNGGYSGVLETTCGSSIIAVGDTLYELSGVDLIERDDDVVDMSSADCTGVDIDQPADCYSGETSSSLDGGVELTITICYCKHVGDVNTAYRSNVGAKVRGANLIVVPDDELHICFDFDYVSQMVAFDTAGSTYYYDFELAIPGDDTSADLSIASAPKSSAGAFMCGEAEPTPSPVEPTPPTPEPTAPPVPDPTPAPLKPTAPPVDPTTPAPTAITPSPVAPDPTPPPQPPPTPAPAPPPTPGPVVPEPEPTSAPVAPEPEPTPAPVADSTSAPVKPVAVPDLTPRPVAPSPEPTAKPTRAAVTPKPSVAPSSPGPTTAPMAPPTTSASPAPSAISNTSRPAATVTTLGPVLLPTVTPLGVPPTGAPVEAAARPTLGPSGAESATTSSAPSAVVSTSSERTVEGETAAPVPPSDGEGHECDLPLDASCTAKTWAGNLDMGVGMFYDPVCNTTSIAEEKEPGCRGDSEACRLCLFNTTRFMENNPGEDLPDYPVCPCCVLSAYKETTDDADGSICGNASPAPIVVTTAPSVALGSAERVSRIQSFQDTSLGVRGSNGVAVAALGLLGVLTFLPIFSK